MKAIQKIWLAVLIALILDVFGSNGLAATITVNSLNDPSDKGFCTLHDAITSANSLSATNGCSAGDGNDLINFVVSSTISLQGTLPTITRTLVIDGTGQTLTIDGGSSNRIMSVGSGAVVTVKNLTLAHGGGVPFGAAIDNEGGNLTINGCTFSNNTAILVSSQVPYGGAILSESAAQAAVLNVMNSTFSTNSAQRGGAIANLNGNLIVSASTFTSNTTSGDTGVVGGAILSGTGTASVTNSTFTKNSAVLGGAIEAQDNPVTVIGSTFDSNTAEGAGGGIEFEAATLTVLNSTFSGNSAKELRGGAIAPFGTLMLTNSTIVGNSAPAGGGLYNVSVADVKGTIFAGNTGGNCAGDNAVVDLGYNISDDKTCGFIANGSANNGDGVNPKLDPAGLHDNGGPTQTIAVLQGSPAVDAIPHSACSDQQDPGQQITIDQRGEPRPDPEDGPNGPCDIGAYELQEQNSIDCSKASASLPNVIAYPGAFAPEGIKGVIDPNGSATSTITGVTQDRPVIGGPYICQDAYGVGTSTAWVRATPALSGGLIYKLAFKAQDKKSGASCTGIASVCINDLFHVGQCKDTGNHYDSTICRH